MKIVIFSGTTEGRVLSDMLNEDKIEHIVCVASQYGSDMMKENEYCKVHVGRMDSSEMLTFLKERKIGSDSIIVDATHPYAVEVTENIRCVTSEIGCRCIRVLREGKNINISDQYYYDSIKECAKKLVNTKGNILLTTGSKQLHDFCDVFGEQDKKRIYVRVLPVKESLDICSNEGIDPKNIIAMHGPFSMELNKAVIKQYNIKHLITKESGTAGGFEDKILACKELKTDCHVIRRPEKENGSNIYEAYELITGKSYNAKLCVTLAGIGVGAEALMTDEVKEAIESADIVFGAKRLILGINAKKTYAMYLAKDIIPVLQENEGGIRQAVILFSGDSGFYSGAKAMREQIRGWRKDIKIKVCPGISSFSYLAAQVGESYEDAVFYSIHGRKDKYSINELINYIKFNRKTFVLIGKDADINDVGKKLRDENIACDVIVGYNLSYPDEKIIKLNVDESIIFKQNGIMTVLYINEQYSRKPLMKTFEDDEFLRDRTPMTKACVRHESIARLKLKKGDVVYDVGAGTGSVAIEAAALDASLKVYAFEKEETSVSLIEKNIEKLGIANIEVICGMAPQALEGIQLPDCVFIGGSKGRLKDIIKYIHDKKKNVNYVINAVSLETIEEVNELMNSYEVEDSRIIQLSCSDVKNVGNYHMLQAQNPVMIFSFRL